MEVFILYPIDQVDVSFKISNFSAQPHLSWDTWLIYSSYPDQSGTDSMTYPGLGVTAVLR